MEPETKKHFQAGKGVCPYCGVGCIVSATVSQNKILKISAEKNVEPKWFDPHGQNVRKEEAKRQAAVDAACRGESRK